MYFEEFGSGQVVVLIHGLGASSAFWHSTVERIVGFRRAVVVDLPGFGQSPRFETATEISAYSDAIAELLLDLELANCDIVGHSLGGLIAQRIAIDHPALVRNLVLVAPGDLDVGSVRKAVMGRGFQCASWLLQRGTQRRKVMTSAGARRLVAALGVATQMPPGMAEELIFNGMASPGLSSAIDAALRDTTFTESDQISCPTLIVQGSCDRLVTQGSARALAGRIPRADLQLWDGVGHCPMFQRPDDFAATLIALADVSVGRDARPPDRTSFLRK